MLSNDKVEHRIDDQLALEPMHIKDEVRQHNLLDIDTDSVRMLLMVRQLIDGYKNDQEELERSLEITIVDSTDVGINLNSIEYFIARVLKGNEQGMHVTNIIDALGGLGYTINSEHHKYSTVYRACSDNYYMFMRVGKATFKLREAFFNRKPARPVQIVKPESLPSDKVTTFTDIIVSVVKDFQTEYGIYPGRVWNIMNHIGYKCSYSAVHRAMQGDLFIRDGFAYFLAEQHVQNQTEIIKSAEEIRHT